MALKKYNSAQGNLPIPPYGGGETLAQAEAINKTAITALPDALAAWIASSN